ncbi:unnamed protein product [Phytomonas sp. EM1]|nr:unnamed protein product [Phytomonas sp. EM1]|eukprot:CCW65569.1 unnamed protein product [Phytomonas sp. isolate EM1]
MFHRKYIIKETHPLGKRETKKFKEDVAAILGPKFSSICESLFSKKNPILKQVWKIAEASAVLYLVDQVPLFVTVEEFPHDMDVALFRFPNRNIMLPTIFLLLLARLIFHETSQNMIDFSQSVGFSVSCHSPTSRHILSGAHLMMPGIVSCTKGGSSENVEGSITLIYALQNDTPFAVGLATHYLAAKSSSGIGIYVISCFNDLMWKHFYSSFHMKSLAFSIGLNSVPREFTEKQIFPVISDAGNDLLLDDLEKQVDDTSDEPLPDNIQDSDFSSILEECHQLFPDEESILEFSFCEAVKSIKPSMLPLPLSEFTAIFVKSYPLISSDSKEIDFRKTHVKKALSYFKRFPDVIEITEISEGNYVIVNRNRDAPLLRDHNSKFSIFLKEIHEPRKAQLSQKNQMDKLRDFSTVVLPKIISVSELYFVGKDLEQDFFTSFFVDSGAFQAITQSSELPKERITNLDNVDKPSVDPSIFNDGLTAKEIMNAVNNYIKLNKLTVSLSQDSKIPFVKLDAKLSQFACSNSSEMLITTLRDRILRRFTLKHKIVWKPAVQNDSMDVDDIHSRCILANGSPPIVKIWTKMERGNKIITIVENLDHYCLDFHTISAFFRKQLATSCFEYSQNGKLETLKGGKKNKLLTALKGDLKDKVRKLILNEFGIPSQYVN